MGVGASEGVLLCLGAVGGSGRSGGLEAHASCTNSWERHTLNVLSVRSRTSILPPFAGCHRWAALSSEHGGIKPISAGMSGFEPLIPLAACAGAKAANKAVKEVTGKSIVSHCKSAAKGLRNIVLQKAVEKASKKAEEVLFNQEARAEFKRRLDSLEYLLDDVASNSAMVADPSVVAELEALCSVLKSAASARLDADGRSDALTAIDRHMNSLHLALAANTNKKIQNVEEKLDGVVDGVVEKVGQRLDGAVEKIGANVEQKLDGALDRIERNVEQKFDVFLSLAGNQIRDKVLAALAKELPPGCEIADLFAEARGTRQRRQVHRARVAVDDKASLDALRDRVVLKTEDDSLENAINKALQTTGGERISVNRGAFLESYEQTVMRFTKLTEHQREKLETVRREPVAVLLAHAGAGKTFFAIQRMAQVLNSDPRAMLLFVARKTRTGVLRLQVARLRLASVGRSDRRPRSRAGGAVRRRTAARARRSGGRAAATFAWLCRKMRVCARRRGRGASSRRRAEAA